MSRTIAPPRSCARISTSSTRSLVASARSSLSELERGSGSEHARQLREPREGDAQRRRPGRRQVRHRLGERETGGDRRDDVAQAVGPRGLHLAHARAGAGARSSRAGSKRDRDRRAPTRRTPIRSARRPRAARTSPASALPAQKRRGPEPDAGLLQPQRWRARARARGDRRGRLAADGAASCPSSAAATSAQHDADAPARRAPSRDHLGRLEQVAQACVPRGKRPIDACFEPGRERARPLERSTERRRARRSARTSGPRRGSGRPP